MYNTATTTATVANNAAPVGFAPLGLFATAPAPYIGKRCAPAISARAVLAANGCTPCQAQAALNWLGNAALARRKYAMPRAV